MARAGFCLVLIGDSTPQQVSDVGRQRVHLTFLPIERQCKVLFVRNPEILIETVFQIGGLSLQAIRGLCIVPECTS
jgi:hypothetical protein